MEEGLIKIIFTYTFQFIVSLNVFFNATVKENHSFQISMLGKDHNRIIIEYI